jgi:hypothetical protein
MYMHSTTSTLHTQLASPQQHALNSTTDIQTSTLIPLHSASSLPQILDDTASTMPKTKKAHVFNTRKSKSIKSASRTRPIGAVISMQSLNARLNSIPKQRLTFSSSQAQGNQEIRAKIISASLDVSPGGRSDFVSHDHLSIRRPDQELVRSVDTALYRANAGSSTAEISQRITKQITQDSEEYKMAIKPLSEPEEQDDHAVAQAVPSLPSSEAPNISEADLEDELYSNRHARRTWGRSCLPGPGTALNILGPSSLPPAFLPGYSNTWKSSTELPNVRQLREQHQKTPAYARPSMSSWFRAPTTSHLGGTPTALDPADTTLSHLSDGRDSSRACGSSHQDGTSCVEDAPDATPSHMSYQNDKGTVQLQEVSDAHRHHNSPKLRSVASSSTTFEAVLTCESSSTFTPADGQKVSNTNITLTSASCLSEQTKHDLMGAMGQENIQEPVLWFDREPFAPFDEDLSGDEDDDEVIHHNSKIPTLRNALRGGEHAVFPAYKSYNDLGSPLADQARKISDSDRSTTLMSEDLGFPASQSLSTSSHDSQSSLN